MLYTHSYASWVWNRLASFRLKLGGLKPMLGDIVYKSDKVSFHVTIFNK